MSHTTTNNDGDYESDDDSVGSITPPNKKAKNNNSIEKICTECILPALFAFKKCQPVHCKTHKQTGEVNVYTSRYCLTCIDENCSEVKRASYGIPGTKKVLRCTEHKLPTDVDVGNKKCESCKKIKPTYAKEGEFAKRCFSCKLEDDVDVVNKNNLCEICKTTQASFGYLDENKLKRCGKCKLINDVQLKKGLLCIYEGCQTSSSFGLVGTNKKTHCFKHKLPEEVRLRGLCNSCGLIRTKNPYYEGMCLNCFIHKYPEKRNSRNIKTKERAVREFLENNFGNNYTITFDRMVEGGCSKFRPDAIIDLGTHVVIIEVDEDQHRYSTYTPECEERRINELFLDNQFRPIVFIRFNPDSYENNSGIVNSPWTYYNNVIHVPISNKNKWNQRLDYLKERMEYHIQNIPSEKIMNDYLYYDGFGN